jgi:hypothetical protein
MWQPAFKAGLHRLLEAQCCLAILRGYSNIAGLSVHMNQNFFPFFYSQAKEIFTRFLFGLKQNNHSTDTTIQHL